MPEFTFDALPDPVALRDAKFDPTSGEVLGTAAESFWNALYTTRATNISTESTKAREAVQNTGGPAIDPRTAGSDVDAMAAERGDGPDTTQVAPADAIKQAQDKGAKLTPFTAPVSQHMLDGLIDDHLAEQKRQDVISRNTSLVSGVVPRFAVGALVSLADPLNIAAMMVPVAPEAWTAARLAAAGSGLGRAGVRAAVGGAQGAAGMAALEPLNYALDSAEHKDWSAGEALRNIAFGAALGAAGHAFFGAIGDRLNPETREAALRASIGQVMEGRPVDVEPILKRGAADEAGAALRRPIEPEEGGNAPPANTAPSMRADMEARLAKVESELADPATPEEARASLTRESQVLQNAMAEPDTLRTQADVAAKDMAARANVQTPPEVVQAEKANAATIERAPKLETTDKATAEIEDMAKEFQARYDTEVASGRLKESPTLDEVGKDIEAEGKARADYLNCYLGRI